MKKIIENINFIDTWSSYMNSTYAVLKACGYIEEEYYKIIGYTGLGFHFIINDKIDSSGPTVYSWDYEHYMMMDRIGIYTEQINNYDRAEKNTFGFFKDDCIQKVIQSIDRGIGVITWAPTDLLEFGVIYGYDKEDGIFLVKDVLKSDSDPMLFENLGKSKTLIFYIQLIKNKIKVSTEKKIRDSLKYAVYQWNKKYNISSNYSNGKKAYQKFIEALKNKKYDNFGLAYNVHLYSDYKNNINKYFEYIFNEACTSYKEKKVILQMYKKVAENFQEMKNLIPFNKEKAYVINETTENKIINILEECSQLEEKIFDILKKELKM